MQWETISSIAAGSVLVRSVVTAARVSRVATGIQEVGERIDSARRRARTAVGGSGVVGAIGSRVEYCRAGVTKSRIVAIASACIRVVGASTGYRWLTDDPESKVVIDLQSTRTLKPVVEVVDSLLKWILPAAVHSLLVAGSHRAVVSIRRAPIRVASSLLLSVSLSGAVAAVATDRSVVFLVFAGTSLLAIAGRTVRTSWAELTATTPGRIATELLTPPRTGDRRTDSEPSHPEPSAESSDPSVGGNQAK